MRISALIGFTAALILLTTACNTTSPPTPAPILTSTSVPTAVANTPAPIPGAATATAAPAAASASTPAPPAPTPGPGTPGPVKTEEKESPAPGEEAAEGAPQPNPLATLGPGGNPLFAPVPGAAITKNGAAATIKGSAAAGQIVYAQNCAACHGPDGKGGVPNPGSDDGTIPPLNPVDPGFKAAAKGDYAEFAGGLDLFIQHGSRPAGKNPTFSMIPWGDLNKLTQQQIADVEAHVIQLNGS
jgi:cytochrome c553